MEPDHESAVPPAAPAREVALIVALAALMLFPSWPFRDLWTPDEPRYMEVAREMALTGNYLVPHLNGETYPDKPPVFFWLAAGFYKLGFGYNSGRLVAALAAIGTLLLVLAFARRTMPRPGPLISALATLTAALFLEAKAGVLDPLLMFFVAAALFSGYRALQPETGRRTMWWLGFYGLAAVGVLTKGPVGILLPGLVILTYAAVNRKRVRAGGWAHFAGSALFLAIVLAWLVPATCAGGEAYRNEILFSQTLNRAVQSYSHRQPFYYFFARFPMDFFPWSLLVPLALVEAVRRWRRGREGEALFPALWFASIFIFHSVISGKRQGYLMPLLPAVGLMTGGYISRGLRGGFPWPRWHKRLISITFVLLGLAGVVAGAALFVLPELVDLFPKVSHLKGQAASFVTPQLLALGVVLGLVILLVSVLGLRLAAKERKFVRLTGLFVAAALVASLAADLVVAPRLNRIKSARFFCEQAEPLLKRADKVHLLRNDMSGFYNLYTGRVSMPILQDADDVRRALASGTPVAIIADEHRWHKMTGIDVSKCCVAVRRPVGSRMMILIINWSSRTGR